MDLRNISSQGLLPTQNLVAVSSHGLLTGEEPAFHLSSTGPVWRILSYALNRIWCYTMPPPPLPVSARYKTTRERKSFGFDFSNFPAVKAGKPISNARVVIADGNGVIIIALEILDEEFYDSDTSTIIPPGKGVRVQLSSGIVGNYDIVCRIECDGDDLDLPGKLWIVAAV